MVGPPDPENPPTAHATGSHPDLTLNDPPSAADVDTAADLRLEPEADSLSTFGPEQAPLERDSVPPPALAHAQPPRVDALHSDTYIVWPIDDEDRSWWSRLRSWMPSRETKQQSSPDEPIATETHIAAPAARTDPMTIEAIRNVEIHLASLAGLRDACASIDRRLARVEAAVQRSNETLVSRDGVAAESFQELSTRMTTRFAEAEETIQRMGRERVDEMMRLTQQSLADSKIPEMCVDIEVQLAQARMTLQRTEDAVMDRTLHELCKNIEARIGRTEDTLRRHEGIVTEWLQELSADMTARFAEAEESIQRIETVVSSRLAEQISSRPSSVQTDNRLVEAAPVWQPWMARLAVPVLVLVAALAIANLIRTSPGVARETVVPPTNEQVVTPVEQATSPVVRAVSTTAPIADVPLSTRENRVSVPQQPSSDRKSASTTSRSPRFVGTLSITSVPSGASVSINGKPAGKTPLRLPRQRAGSMAVQVAHDGFERWSAAVLVPADQLTQVTAKLRASAR